MATQFLPIKTAGTATPHAYRSHKIVQAVRIEQVKEGSTGGAILGLADNFAPYVAVPEMTVRYMPVPGDYLMLYPDGYVSISPRQAFEEGYERV